MISDFGMRNGKTDPLFAPNSELHCSELSPPNSSLFPFSFIYVYNEIWEYAIPVEEKSKSRLNPGARKSVLTAAVISIAV